MNSDREDRIDLDLANAILPASGTMMGVCITLVGLVRVVEAHRNSPSHVDEYAALVALLFLASTLVSYAAIRGRRSGRNSLRFEYIADRLFIIGIICLAAIGLLFAYEVI